MARFYAAITGWDVASDSAADWSQLMSSRGATIAFQRVDDYRPPEWPGCEHPQQLHLDFDVPDLDDGERQVLAFGARKAATQPGWTFRVFLDPADHPFCLRPCRRARSRALTRLSGSAGAETRRRLPNTASLRDRSVEGFSSPLAQTGYCRAGAVLVPCGDDP
jgi:hypothetical protein